MKNDKLVVVYTKSFNKADEILFAILKAKKPDSNYSVTIVE